MLTEPPPFKLASRDDLKSLKRAYLFWFLLGGWGVHKLYLNQKKAFITYLSMTVVGWLCIFLSTGELTTTIGILLLVAVAFMLVVDMFRLPSKVKKINEPIYAVLIERRRRQKSDYVQNQPAGMVWSTYLDQWVPEGHVDKTPASD